MKKPLLFGAILMLAIGCGSLKKPVSFEKLPFYETHLGLYADTLRIYKEDSLLRALPMQLYFQKTDTLGKYIWEIKYDTQAPRAYRLVIEDGAKGKYVIDEQNGIVLPCQLNNGVLSSYFKVMDNNLLITYRFKVPGQIGFNVQVFSSKETSFTGQQNQEIDSIGLFQYNGFQEAILTLKNKN